MKQFDYSKLKSLREEKNITQKGMSTLLHMTQSNYSKLEKGKRKIDSLQTIAKLAEVLEMTEDRLTGILSGDQNIDSAGINASELLQVQNILSKSLRSDEFVFFSVSVLNVEKYDFKEYFSGLNLAKIDFAVPEFTPSSLDMNIFTSEHVEIGFDYKGKQLNAVSIWLGDKKLGLIPGYYNSLVDELINHLLISRVVLIGNEDAFWGYFDTYMKVAFISTNAVNKSANFENGRFSAIEFMNKEDIEKLDEEPI